MFCNWCDSYVPDVKSGKKASVFRRFVATVIDPFVILIFYVLVIWTFGGEMGALIIAIFAYLIFSLWFLSKGMTPGKWLLGLKVIEKLDGRNPGLLRMIIRETVGKFVSGFFLGLGYLG